MNTIRVEEVISPGTLRAADGSMYVLRGVPDVEEEVPRFSEARALVRDTLLGVELSFDDETSLELPDLPGRAIEAFDAHGKAVTPWLAARVAGILSGHPLR